MKKITIYLLVAITCLSLFAGCESKDLDLNHEMFRDMNEKQEYDDMFNEIEERSDNHHAIMTGSGSDSAKSFYGLFVTMQQIILNYEDLYKDRKKSPTFSDKIVWDDLKYLSKLYKDDPEKYDFLLPLVDIYSDIGRDNLSENQIEKIKDKIIYALDYYYE